MSCPDWQRLATAREAGRDEEAWAAALEHLDGCPDCRPRALRADPCLVFRDLPAVEADAAEVAAMRQAVGALRQARRVATTVPAAGGRWRRLRPSGRTARRVAAAAVVAAASLGVWLERPAPAPAVDAAPVAAATAVPADGPGSGRRPAPARVATPQGGPAEPVVDGLVRPRRADVYQVDGDGLRVVMVVDETLDV